jgi:hypothetical protein
VAFIMSILPILLGAVLGCEVEILPDLLGQLDGQAVFSEMALRFQAVGATANDGLILED